MNKEELIVRINEIITDVTGITIPDDGYSNNCNLSPDLGFDLLDKIEINMAIEDEFNLSIIHDEDINTPNELYDYVFQKLEEKSNVNAQ